MTSVLLGLVLGALVAGGNVWMLGWPGDESLRLAWFVAAPLVATLATALAARATASSRAAGPARKDVAARDEPAGVAPPKPAEPAKPAAPAKPAEPAEHTALRLLAALQEDGRLIDFLQEDIAPYSDQQVGAATRGIHESCAKALRACVTLEAVMPGREEESVTVPAGFDPASVRLVGNVQGKPPFKGTLRHPGWRVTSVTIPERRGLDPRIVAPAEVELA